MIPAMAPAYSPSDPPKAKKNTRRPGTAPSRLTNDTGKSLPLTSLAYSSHLKSRRSPPQLNSRLDPPILAPVIQREVTLVRPTNGRVPIHHRTRSSVDMERPVVDPTIRGIPQGWDDDPMMALALPEVTTPPSSFASHSRPRTSPFKETRTKLTSFSGIAKAHLGIGEVGRDAHLQRSNTRNAPVRSSSLATTHPRGPLTPAISETSLSSTSHTSFFFPPRSNTPLSPPALSTTTSPPSTDFIHLVTPQSAATDPYTPSLTSTQDSGDSHLHSRRERVLGLRNEMVGNLASAGGSKVFLLPKLADVLPLAGSRPFAAWEVPVAEEVNVGAGVERGREKMDKRKSVMMGELVKQAVVSKEGWRDLEFEKDGAAKKVWVDAEGEQVAGVYRVGWERDILDLEARLHETVYDIAGERHTFANFEQGKEPKTVLDASNLIGTGTGKWPISQALLWPGTRFVGLDIVPCQTDLSILAAAEGRARSTSVGQVEGVGIWESVEKRITWDRANFLETLPYDTGVFDHVHLRFLNLGVPESKWFDLIEESLRVLKSGGTLEIVETTYTLPSHSPPSLRNSFASLLLADEISSDPKLSIQFNLPLIESIRGGASRPVFERTWGAQDVPGALRDGVEGWVKSCLEYKGTGIVKGVNGDSVGRRARRDLAAMDPSRWTGDVGGEEGGRMLGQAKGDVSVWAWVCIKR